MAVPADIVGYEPAAVPGSYLFQRRGGAPLVLGGELAERFKQQLDATAPPDMRVAGPGGAPQERSALRKGWDSLTGQTPAAPAPAAPKPPTPVAPAPPAPNQSLPPPAEANQSVAPPPGAAPKPALAPQASPAPAQPQEKVIGSGKGGQRFIRGADGMIRVVSPGSPGKSRAKLAQEANQGVEKPERTETVREVGPQGDPDYLENQANLSIDRRLHNMQMADRQAAEASQDALEYGREAARLQKQKEIEANVAVRVADETRRAEAEYDQARNEFRDKKVDPERLFRGPGGTLRKIAMAIAQAVGAYGATLGRTANFAQQIVQSRIEEDIAAQREEIRVRGQHTDNALANLTRKMGDQRAAEAVLRSAQGDYASALMRTRAAASKRQEVIDIAEKFDLDEQARQIEIRNQYMKEREGKITQKMLSEFAYPTAGSGPTDRPATLEEQARFEDLQGKRLANEGAAQKIQAAEGGGEAPDAQVKQYNDNANAVDAGEADLAKYASAIGAKRNPETGVWEGDVSGVWRTGIGASDRSQNISAQAETLVPGIARALEGGSAPNAENMKALKEEFVSASGDKMLAVLNATQQRIDSQRAAVESSVPQGVVDQRRKRGQQGNVRRATAAAPGQALPAPRPVAPQ